jgi:hypothetical protein
MVTDIETERAYLCELQRFGKITDVESEELDRLSAMPAALVSASDFIRLSRMSFFAKGRTWAWCNVAGQWREAMF